MPKTIVEFFPLAFTLAFGPKLNCCSCYEDHGCTIVTDNQRIRQIKKQELATWR